MADLKVKFLHPTDGSQITVTLDDSMTGGEVIGELLANDFIEPHDQGYELNVKGGPQIRDDQPLSEVDVEEGDKVRVVPSTEAGSTEAL